ncbi:acyl-CoA thioesterase [Pseudonocardia sp.]|uniref:acyl-CoA thioesterase n=1 Tax=Pseudonocardia sp. TaxID=60912 RepID=UPI0026116039|nr:acyl-CoA thioesterase [Pseudonocardia sp.]
MSGDFSVRVGVRSYEVDVNGHLNHAIYHRYGEHARSELLAAAGCSMPQMLEQGVGIVLLETTCRFLRELRYGDELDVDARVGFGEGKTFRIAQTLRRLDGVVAAEITCVMGLLDSRARRLLPDPREQLRKLATDPGVLGIG